MLRTGPTRQEEEAVAAHLAYLQELKAKNVIILVGRTQTTDEDTMGLAIFRAESEEIARQIVNEDPVVKRGVLKATLYPFKVALRE